MPFKGLTWFRLKEHIRKTFWIYVAGVIIMMLASNLIYTITAPRTPAEKEVLVYLVDSFSDVDNDAARALAAEGLAHGSESDETLEAVQFQAIGFQSIEDYTSPILLTARMSVGDGDIYLCSPEGFDYVSKSGLPLPLDDYLADGWLSRLNAETIEWTDEETGETYIAGVSLDGLPFLYDLFRFDYEGSYLVVATNSSNPETSMDVIEHMLYQAMDNAAASEAATEENSDASADREEPAA